MAGRDPTWEEADYNYAMYLATQELEQREALRRLAQEQGMRQQQPQEYVSGEGASWSTDSDVFGSRPVDMMDYLEYKTDQMQLAHSSDDDASESSGARLRCRSCGHAPLLHN